MKISLVICTYMRPHALLKLLKSVESQSIMPDEVVIVDGSLNAETEEILHNENIGLSKKYYRVSQENRGLTRQRNFGISHVAPEMDIVAFLDDDLVLEPDYFEQVLKAFQDCPEAIGVGGIDLKENAYNEIIEGKHYGSFHYYQLDGWVRKDPLRYRTRKAFGLMSDLHPGIIPAYSHGRSGFPPNGKIYRVEHFMGGIATYKKSLFDYINFSRYFEGYGLYEDFDFCVRALSFGKLYVNTKAKAWHYHEEGGRPSKYKYGKMVVRNGWYVWKQRFPQNTLKATFQWHAVEFLNAKFRLINAITGPDRLDAFTEYIGRVAGWFSLLLYPPKIRR